MIFSRFRNGNYDGEKTPVSQMLLNTCRRMASDVSDWWLNHWISAEAVLIQ